VPVAWSYVIDAAPESLSSGALAPSVTLEDVVPKDIAIDPVTGDAKLVTLPDGTKTLVLVSGADAIVQRLRIRFGFWLREWFLDQRQGVPYVERVFVKSPALPLIETLFRRVILPCPGLVRVEDFRMSFDAPRRVLSVDSFRAVLADARTLRFVDTPFIVG
jgi:hypothetical protein